jgi:hypothetical protein
MLAQQENIGQLVHVLESATAQAEAERSQLVRRQHGQVVQQLQEHEAAADAELKQDR